MLLQTLETRFVNDVASAILAGADPNNPAVALDQDTLDLLNGSHYLWPFFLYPGRDAFKAPMGTAILPVVSVRVYRGQWITDCPFCNSAQHASENYHLFFCAGCKNTLAGNCALPVVWPDNPEDIEQILVLRPFVDTQNWYPGETVDDLIAENVANIGVSDL